MPEEIYANAKTVIGIGSHSRRLIKENYLKRRKFILTQLRDGRKPYYSFDADGTCTFKTVQKVENSRSIGSLLDKHFLRNLLKGLWKVGGYFEINTARTGVFPGPSAVGTEGPKFKDAKGEWQNPRSPNEISSLLHEFGIHSLDDPDSKNLYKLLVVNGLSGGIKHDPNGKLAINPATINYGKFIDKLNHIKLPGAEDGFLSKLEEIVSNKKEHKPLKVLEYKSIPEIFDKHPDFSVENYLRYIDLVEKSREQSLDAKEFFQKLNASDIKLPKEYYDPVNPPVNEFELTDKIRKGLLVCLTPHAFDSDNRVRDDIKLLFYKTLAKFANSPEAQEWAEKEFGIPKGTCLFSINGKDVSGIDFENLEKTFTLKEFRDFIKEKCPTPKNKQYILLDAKENPQPYCELAPNTSKADVFPSIEEVRAKNLLIVAAGDSPGTDAPMLAQAILLEGAGFIIRGLMTEQDVAEAMVSQLALPLNQWHNDALTISGKNEKKEELFQHNKTGEIKTKAEWAKDFLPTVEKATYKSSNIHENNAFNAAFFSEFLNSPEFKLELDESKPWVQEVLKATNKRSLVTPTNDSNEKALEGQVYSKSILETYPWLGNIPFVKKYLKIEAAGPFFDNLLSIVSKTMMIATPFELIGEKFGIKPLSTLARYAQKWSYRFNTVASGVSRGLVLSAHQFPWQFIGECFGFSSTFFNDSSKFGKVLRALSNTVLIGRANELAMRSNYNLDEFAKDKTTQETIKEQYEKSPVFKDKKQYFDKATEKRMDRVDYFQYGFLGGIIGKIPFVGRLAASAVADSWQAAVMAYEFVTNKALHQHVLPNFFTLGQVGPTKTSKNSGKPYGEVHEEHAYAFSGIATLGVSIMSIFSMMGKNTFLSSFLTSAANMIPALGIVTAGKLVYQDQAGDPRLFTDINKKQQTYSPEKSGLLQMFGGWGQAVMGMFINTSWGPALYDFATGLYLNGIREQIKIGIDDAAVNQLTRQGKYYVAHKHNGNGAPTARAAKPSGRDPHEQAVLLAKANPSKTTLAA